MKKTVGQLLKEWNLNESQDVYSVTWARLIPTVRGHEPGPDWNYYVLASSASDAINKFEEIFDEENLPKDAYKSLRQTVAKVDDKKTRSLINKSSLSTRGGTKYFVQIW